MPKAKRIVCYAINGAGLGHLTRLTGVARWMRRYVTVLDGVPPEVVFLTSSDASDALADARIAAFKIPSKTVATRSQLNKLEYKRLAKHFVWNTLGVFSPDLLVVDTFPSGSFDELFQVLDGPFKKSFIRRDVKPEYAARATFRAAARMYDCVVTPHARLADSAAHDPLVKVVATGEVIQFEREELLPRDEARRQLGVAEGRRLVYVSAGGGGDRGAEQALAAMIDALKCEKDLHLLVGAGPLYRGPRMSGERITWFDSPSVWRYFGALDASMSAAGYNSFHELLYARVPSVFFAQQKIADDQQQRIREAATSNLCLELENVSDAVEVRAKLRTVLTSEFGAAAERASEERLPENGVRRCASALLAPLYSAEQLSWAARCVTPRLALRLESVANGSPAGLADWLIPLAPRRFETDSTHSLERILPQLSAQAAAEVAALLDGSESTHEFAKFEVALLGLLDVIENSAGENELEAEHLAAAALKTVVAIYKRQSNGEVSCSPSPFAASDAIQSVADLLTSNELALPVSERLQLFRMFPRVVDVEFGEVRQLFERFVRGKLLRGDGPHELGQQIQVLKMTHPRVTRETLASLAGGVSS